MEYVCPDCGSENVQKLSLTVMKGTKNGAIGSTQTALAEIHSPPTERRWVWWALGLFLFGPGAVTTGHGFFIVVAISCALGLGYAWYYNNVQYQKELIAWNRLWICQRCATVFKLGGEFQN